MKSLFYLFLVFLNYAVCAQTSDIEDVFWDIVDMKIYPDETTEVGYLKVIEPQLLNYHLEKFETDTIKTYYKYVSKIQVSDSIILTADEKEFLVSEIKKNQNHEWKLSIPNELIVVQKDQILPFLEKNRLRELKIISKPIFIRANSICLVLNIHFCCGHIAGNSNLSFFKKENDHWKKWITVSHGDY